jgi:putative transposase
MSGASYKSVWIHFIWATKNRLPLLAENTRLKLYDYIREICKELNYYLDFINGVEDHVHLLMGLHTSDTIADMAKNIKGKSWKWMRDQCLIEEYFSWQDGYAVYSVSPSDVQRVRNYIANQKEHHRFVTLDEELEQLKKNNLKQKKGNS